MLLLSIQYFTRILSQEVLYCREAVVQKCSAKICSQKFCKIHRKPPVPEFPSGPEPATLLKKRTWHRCFPVNFVKFLRTPFLTDHLWWLLLIVICTVIANTIIVAQRRFQNHVKYLWQNFFEKKVKSQKLNCFLKILLIMPRQLFLFHAL